MSLAKLSADNAKAAGGGSFWVLNNTWGKGSLVNGLDYTESITFDSSTSPSGIVISWNWPMATSVLAYPEVLYGASPFQPPPSGVTLPTPAQVADFVNLSTQYSFSISGQTSNFDVTFDIWLTSVPDGGRDTRTDELMVVVHNPWNWGKGQTPDFSTGGLNVWNSGTQTDGTLTWNMLSAIAPTDMLTGTISISDILKGLIWNGSISGNEYISGIEVGAEVGGGTGSLTINNLGYQWNAKSTINGTTGNDTFTVTTVGGNHFVGNGGTDTVVYQGTYSHFQLKVSGGELLLQQDNNISLLDVLQGINYVKFSDGTYDVTSGTFTYNTPEIVSFSPDSNVVGDGVTNANQINLAGTAAANSQVQVYDGTMLIGTTTADANGAWTFRAGTLADGNHSFIAKDIDSTGALSTASAALNVTVDTEAPIAPVIVGDAITSTHQVVVNGTAEANSTVNLYEGTTLLGMTITKATGVWSVTTPVLTSGSHIFSATATDAAGNVSAVSQALDPIIPSLSAPTILSFAPDSAVIGDGITNANQVTLAGSAAANTTVEVFDGRTLVDTAAVNAAGAWSFATAHLADGGHTFTAEDADGTGDVSAASNSLSVIVDTIAPNVTVGLAVDTGTSSLDKITSNPTLSGGGDPSTIVTIKDGTVTLGTTTSDATGHWTFNPTGLADGSHTILAVESDAAGNSGSSSSTFLLATKAPIPTISSASLSQTTVTMTGSTAEANDKIYIYDGSTLLGTTTSGSSGVFNFVTPKMSDAVHTLTVNAVDSAGNVGTGPNEVILGSSKADNLVGTAASDFIFGNGGNDTITGGGGANTLVAGKGSVAFIFKSVTDSTPASHDTIVNFDHTSDSIVFSGVAGISLFQGKLTASGSNFSLSSHSVGYIEAGGNTEVFVNTSSNVETVTASDAHAANMEIVLAGTRLGLTGSDFLFH